MSVQPGLGGCFQVSPESPEGQAGGSTGLSLFLDPGGVEGHRLENALAFIVQDCTPGFTCISLLHVQTSCLKSCYG